MAKKAVVGCFSVPLDSLLGTRAKVGVLRVLSKSAVPLGYREVARRSGMAFRSIELAIKLCDDLECVSFMAGQKPGEMNVIQMAQCAANLHLPIGINQCFYQSVQ